MAWPSPVTAGQAVLASQFDSIVTALSTWGGAASAAGYPLNDLPSIGLHSTNASWQEFQLVVSAGGSQSADVLNLQYNARTSSGGSDSWSSFASIAVSSGAITLPGALTFSSQYVYLGTNQFWLQNTGTALFFNAYFGGAWNQTANISATNGYWTFQQVVTFSNSANINFGSNWQSWSPTVAASGSMTVSSVTVSEALYLRIGPIVYYKAYISLTTGGTASNQITISLPVAAIANAITSAGTAMVGPSYTSSISFIYPAGGVIQVLNSGLSNFGLGNFVIQISGFYRAA